MSREDPAARLDRSACATPIPKVAIMPFGAAAVSCSLRALPFASARSGLVGLVVNILLLRGFFAYDLGTPYGCHVAAHIDPGFLAAVFLVIDIGIGAIYLFFPVCVGVLGGVAMLM